jgi:iron complex outermembrane receptor protein
MRTRNIQRRHLALVASGSMALAIGTTAWAQETVPATTPAAEEAPVGGDILVTARRREERLQQVPVAVTAISGDDLARQSIVTLSDLTTKVPAIQIMPTAFSANIPRFVIRAQSQLEPLFAQDPSVAVYFADVVQARAHGVNGAMYDLASVQVLKGPQGTLFGRNSTGGAVLIVPKAPTPNLEGYGSIEVGNYGLRSLEGAVNIPLSDDLQIRLAGRSYAHNGYTRSVTTGIGFDDADNWSLRLGVKARIGDRITNTLFVNNFSATENGTALKLFNARPNLSGFTLGVPALAEFAASQSEGFHTVRTAFGADTSRIRTFGVENTTIFELNDELSIKNIFGYRHVSSDVPFDFDGTTQAMYQGRVTLKGRQYSDELQLVGKIGDLDLIGGAYVFKENGQEIQNTLLDYRPAFIQSAYGQADVTNKSQSLFAQGSYHVPGIEGLSLTAGVRYTWDQRGLHRVAFNGANCSLVSADVGGTPLTPCERTGSYRHKEPTYTLGADWQIDPTKLIYFATRKGYRSGGINQRANLPSQFVPYQPETVTDYEVGLKADWRLGALGKLRTNIATFYQDYKDIQRTQTQTVGVAPSTILITNVVNAAKARVKGVEVDATWNPIPAITLRGYYSLADAKYKQWIVPLAGGGTQDRSGFPFANVPKNSGGASATYRQQLGGNVGEVAISTDLYTQSKVQISDDNLIPEGINPGYTVINARLEWNGVMGSGVDVAAWVRNIAKEKYYTSGVGVASAGLGFTVKTIGAPRTFGVSARIDF